MTPTRVVAALLLGLALIAGGINRAIASAEPAPADAEKTPHQTGEAAASHEVDTNPLSWSQDLAIWTGVVFLVLMAILWKFAWGPIREGLQRREQGIAEQIDQAEQANKEARELLSQYEQKLAGAKEEVREILVRARRDAEQLGQDMLEKARQEAQAERQRALRQIDDATSAALKELAAKGADLALNLAGKIVRAELKPDDHARLIERTISDFAKQGSGGNGTT